MRLAQARDYRKHLYSYVRDVPIRYGLCALGEMPLDGIPRHVQALRDRLREMGGRRLLPRVAELLRIALSLAADPPIVQHRDHEKGECAGCPTPR